MTPDMSFECLLVSRDPAVVGVVERILRNLSISTKICPTHSRAISELHSGCPDLFVIDWDGEPSLDLLQDIWRVNGKPKPTLVAVSNMDLIPGAHITLCKPVTAENGMKSLKMAYYRMLVDHRRHVRYAVMSSVEVLRNQSAHFIAIVTDIGEGGLGLSTKQNLNVGDLLSLHLPLSGTKRPIFVEVKVLWVRDYGRIGCEFVRMPPVDRDIFREWLTNKAQVKRPLKEMNESSLVRLRGEDAST